VGSLLTDIVALIVPVKVGGNTMKTLHETFLAHPEAVGESYFEHMAFAFRFSGRLFKAALAAFVHGVVPAACETTASATVLAMNEEIRARRALMASGIAHASRLREPKTSQTASSLR
jgi:hypothetical protein